MQTTQVDWHRYAQTYDMLLAYNPFYQQLHAEVMHQVQSLVIEPGDQIADIGAGTGNYSLEIASLFPHAQILHLDSNAGMNARAAEKQVERGAHNHRIVTCPVADAAIAADSLRTLVSVHALYAFPSPHQVLRQFYDWIRPGGHAVLVDAGRVLKILDWQMAICWHLLRRYGVRKTLEIFKEGKSVSRQNRYIRDLQRDGTFWTHSTDEFCEAIEAAGFQLIHKQTTFRGYSDLVLAYKPA